MTAIKLAIAAINKKPFASFPKPVQKTIGNARPAMRLVPVWAPSIRNPVRFVLSLLSEVILGVRDEKGTLTIVKNVLCNILIKTNTINKSTPSKGGTQKRRTKDKAKGIFPNNR
jgi:hypothetical protein